MFFPHAQQQLRDAWIDDSSSMVISAIRIPIQRCPPDVQHHVKNNKRIGRISRRRPAWLRLGSVLISLLTFGTIQTVHAIPGTNHALTPGRTKDEFRQQQIIQSLVNNNSSSNPEVYAKEKAEDAVVRSNPHPRCFVADTDSVSYVLDSGANRVIIKDATLFTTFQSVAGQNVKGIEGTAVAIYGTGTVYLLLKSDSGRVDKVCIDDAVYVPSSPYNLVPPQLLLDKMVAQDYNIKPSQLDHKQYTFHYSIGDSGEQTVTIPIWVNKLFVYQTNEGYTKFSKKAVALNSEWETFAGNAHIIPDDNDSVACDKAREPVSQTREHFNAESIDRTREHTNAETTITHHIPEADEDFETNQDPISIEFQVDKHNPPALDPNIEAIRRKQNRLSTIHERLGHVSFAKLRLMARAGLIPKELANVDPPVCPGCAYGKNHRKPWRSKGIKNRKQIKQATQPGAVVSVDQLISPTPGLIPTHRGTPTTKRYKGATVFVDHYSDFTYIVLMTELNAQTTVQAKQEFERFASSYGVAIRHYHADNGLFDTKAFRLSIQRAGQGLSFCGVNAHHQNGKAESRIKDVTTNARTSLQHAAHRWPKAINASLWPAALKHYTNLRNSLPTEFKRAEYRGKKRITSDSYERSPISKFARTEIEPNLNHYHAFGAPVYVLNDKLQAQQSHNKWEDRSRVGIFLCHSPRHASSVPLILNTQSGNVSPQFHCIYDDDFNTCKRDAKFQSLWQLKAKLFEIKGDRLGGTIKYEDQLLQNPNDESIIVNGKSSPCDVPAPPNNHPLMVIPWNSTETEQANDRSIRPVTDDQQTSPTSEDQSTDEAHEPSITPIVTTRSGRKIKPPSHHNDYLAHTAYLDTFSPQNHDDVCLLQPDIEAFAEPHPLALIQEQILAFVSQSDPDTMYMEDALRQPDRDEFLKAMHKELSDHVRRGHWKVVPISSIPKHKRPLPMVWSMKRKRDPTGEITKWKARLCAGGHKSIEYVDYWNTYSPVVSWNTVRLMIVMALINDWHMQSIDFVLAFPQAPVKTDIYMNPPKVPKNFEIPDLPSYSDRFTKAYKLIKNLYGLKDASKTWFEHLKLGLDQRGWKASEVDTCLFTKNGIILVVYVDDAILISPYKGLIQREIKSLQEEYDLTDDGELKDYLGTRFQRRSDGAIELSQPKMIERVLKIVGLDSKDEHIKLHDTPADSRKLLDKDPDAKARRQKWNYRSAVGCLSYLQAMIRPDITFATQQVARFCNDPSREHEEAVKRICRYLLRTKDYGLLLRPDKTKGLECYVDADWAGSWQDRSSNDPLSSHSRTGYVILYAGCPIMWSSKMQALISLSTTEAEYIALSSALREVIAIMNLMEELKQRGFKLYSPTPKVTCRTFEDNKSCIEIATNHKTRARTKHLSVRLHHFRHHVINKTITIEHVSTLNQLADAFTKPLAFLRDRIMSWPNTQKSKSVDTENINPQIPNRIEILS